MTVIGEIGERGLIERVLKKVEYKTERVILGIGDDSAVLSHCQENKMLVFTMDMLHEKTDFPEILTPEDIGWMSVAVNLSDLASMGATPLCFLASLGLREDMSLNNFDGIIDGINKCCDEYEVEFVGGDIDRHSELTIVGTAVGEAERIVKRSGANVGDLLCTVGCLGGSAASLSMIKENKEMGDDLRRARRERISVKKPRVREGIEIGKFATSSIDMSDGFAVSLYEISDKSGVGFVVEFDELPVDPLLASDNDMDDLLYGGGDYGLLFTVKEEEMEKIEKIEEKEVSVVGRATERREIILRRDGIERVIERRGYDHMVKI